MSASLQLPHGIYRVLIHDLKGALANLQGLFGLMEEEAQVSQYEPLCQWVFNNFLELIESLADLIALEKSQWDIEEEDLEAQYFLQLLQTQSLKNPDFEKLKIESFKAGVPFIKIDTRRVLRCLKQLLHAFKKRLSPLDKITLNIDTKEEFYINFFLKKPDQKLKLLNLPHKSSQWNSSLALEEGEVLLPLVILENLGYKNQWQKEGSNLLLKVKKEG